MGNKSKRNTLAAKALGAQMQICNLSRELEQTKSDMAIISKAFIGYVAEKEKKDEHEAIEIVNSGIAKIVEVLKNKGYTLVMATNPFFPRVATERRVKWAGLNKDDFKVITTYETSKYCKPNPKYFAETCEMAGCLPKETLMVGNDVDEDMSCIKIGMEPYLVTDDLINRHNADISSYKKGTLKDFYEFCCELPSLKG